MGKKETTIAPTCSVCHAEQKINITNVVAHVYNDGKCSVCGASNSESQPIQDENDAYEIGTAEELYWFADKVNNDNTNYGSANAVLTDNITVNSGLTEDKGLLQSLSYDSDGNVINGDTFWRGGVACEDN